MTTCISTEKIYCIFLLQFLSNVDLPLVIPEYGCRKTRYSGICPLPPHEIARFKSERGSSPKSMHVSISLSSKSQSISLTVYDGEMDVDNRVQGKGRGRERRTTGKKYLHGVLAMHLIGSFPIAIFPVENYSLAAAMSDQHLVKRAFTACANSVWKIQTDLIRVFPVCMNNQQSPPISLTVNYIQQASVVLYLYWFPC